MPTHLMHVKIGLVRTGTRDKAVNLLLQAHPWNLIPLGCREAGSGQGRISALGL